jgi:hypothetical protein
VTKAHVFIADSEIVGHTAILNKKIKKFVDSKLDTHPAFLSGACNTVQHSMAAGLSASSGDVLERQAGIKFLGKRLGVTRDRSDIFDHSRFPQK